MVSYAYSFCCVIFFMAKVQISINASKKRKRGERIFQFDTFCKLGYPTNFIGPFQENIKVLLGFGHHEANMVKGMQCWSFQLEVHHHHLSYVRLIVIEEEVGISLYRHCHYCRSFGWGHHMISSKRFHFVLPSKETTLEVDTTKHDHGNAKEANTGNMGPLFGDFKGHLMHGVMHSNGFGHLLCINGLEGGSDFISGQQILDFWDRICNALQLWKVSLIDVARKGSMELRLIHGMVYGEPWFGRWGYRFGHGSYGITEQLYKKSLQALQSLPLHLVPQFAVSGGHEIPMIVAKYQSLCSHPLLTLSDLFRFMLELKSRIALNSQSATDFHGIIAETSCRWSAKRVEMAAQVIVHALKRSEVRWVTRQEVRDAARTYIGDTGLLDYVLKSLGNHVFGNYIVRREVNPVTKVLEYCLEDISSTFPELDDGIRVRVQITRVQLMKDMYYLYKHVLFTDHVVSTDVSAAIPVAIRMVLDTKHLVKEFPCVNNEAMHDEQHMRIMCTVSVRPTTNLVRKGMQPYEMINIGAQATIGDLKREVERMFKDMYLGLKSFVAESVAGYGGDDTERVVEVVRPGRRVVVEGSVKEGGGGEMFEGGGEERIVDCLCGTKEEDGERMVCCDICEVWQHTRCVRISNSEEVPRLFLCGRCESDIVALPPICY